MVEKTELPPGGKTIYVSSSPVYKWFRRYVKSLSSVGSEDAQSNRLFLIGWVATIGFPFYYWVWTDVYPQHYENLSMRLLGVAFALPFLFARRLRSKRWLEMYSYVAITYMAPYFFTFFLFMSDGSPVSSESLLIAVVALFLFDGVVASISWIVGTFLGYLTFSFLVGHLVKPSSAVLVNLPVDLFAILLVSVSKISRRIIDEEKLNGMATVLGTISHELRTPIVSVSASAKGLMQYVPTMVEFYRKHYSLATGPERVPMKFLELTVPAIERIRAEVRTMSGAIDLLLVNAGRAQFKQQIVTVFSVRNLVEETVGRYPFENDLRNLVAIIVKSDFCVEANENLMSMIIINLLKNALRSIARARKGSIEIAIESTPRGGEIRFRDSGSGIPAGQMAHIFKRFHAYPAHEGTGIGLAFCRETLASWGAKISCQSEEGKYCEFEMQFKLADPSAANHTK